MHLAIPLCKASALFEEYKVCAHAQEKNARNKKKFGGGNCFAGRRFSRFQDKYATPFGTRTFVGPIGSASGVDGAKLDSFVFTLHILGESSA
jgi:hypothetical protein